MNKKEFDKCIKIAIAEYERVKDLNDESAYLHWSFIFQDRQLLDWSTNRKADSFARFGYEPGRRYDHAEPRAFRKSIGLMDIRRGWDIFNVRLNRARETAMARPCSICWHFLHSAGCRNAFYTDGKGISKLYL